MCNCAPFPYARGERSALLPWLLSRAVVHSVALDREARDAVTRRGVLPALCGAPLLVAPLTGDRLQGDVGHERWERPKVGLCETRLQKGGRSDPLRLASCERVCGLAPRSRAGLSPKPPIPAAHKTCIASKSPPVTQSFACSVQLARPTLPFDSQLTRRRDVGSDQAAGERGG
jgi:hypothetical protein